MAMKPVALFDLDGTLFRWQLFHELAFELKNRGLYDTATAQSIEEALVKWQGKSFDWAEYETILIEAHKKHLTGMPVEVFESAAQAVVDHSGHKIYNYTRRLAAELKEKGYFLLAVTGSYQEIAEPFARRYGFDDCIGALLPRENGVFTAPDSVRIVFGQKEARIREYMEGRDLTLDESVAVGDSGGDVTMLELATTPIAFNPSEELLDIAMERGWQVVIERKNIAYTLRQDNGLYVLETADRF